MVVKVTKLFDKGRLVEEQMIRLLKKFDKRISDLEGGDTNLQSRVKSLEDLGIADKLSDFESRITALEQNVEPQEVQGDTQETQSETSEPQE